MKHFLRTTAAVCGGLLLAAAPVARAQDMIPALDPTLMVGWAGGEAVRADLEKKAGKSSRPATGAATATTSKASFAYAAPSAAVKQQTVLNFTERLKTTRPAAAQAMAATYAPGKTDYGQQYQALLKDSGLRDNDAADALAAFMILGYQVVNNLQDPKLISVPMARGLRAQAAAVLAKSPKLSSAATRAAVGEEFKLQTVVFALGWGEAIKGNTLPAYQQTVATLFKNQYRMDLSQMKLTAQGFGKK